MSEKNIIYSAGYLKHNKIYIGYTKGQANKRFCGYRYDMKKATEIPSDSKEGGTELSEHFTSSLTSVSITSAVSHLKASLSFVHSNQKHDVILRIRANTSKEARRSHG